MHPYYAAEHGLVDDVIDPAHTRETLVRALEMLEGKRASLAARKHGNPGVAMTADPMFTIRSGRPTEHEIAVLTVALLTCLHRLPRTVRGRRPGAPPGPGRTAGGRLGGLARRAPARRHRLGHRPGLEWPAEAGRPTWTDQ